MKNLVVCATNGIKMPEASAKAVDEVCKNLPKTDEFKIRTISKAVSFEEIREDERIDVAVFSTESVDLQGEIVLSQGLDLEIYKKNPIVMYNHDEVIGKCLWVKHIPQGIKGCTSYAKRPKDWTESWLADKVFEMVRQGIIVGKSIQFQPLQAREPNAEELEKYPNANLVFIKSILLEVSTVDIPCNPNALITNFKKLDRSLLNVKELIKINPVGMVKKKLPQSVKVSQPQQKIQKKVSLQPFYDRVSLLLLDPDQIVKQVLENLQDEHLL